jgi:light-regulated signal transduction histidine kinase (bacteriophytochrome)
LKISNQELESFCYSISHDLRTPLRTIDGFAQMVTEEFGKQLPPAALRYVQRIRHASERMCQLIDGLLAFSRVGRHPLTPVRIDMSVLADKAAEAAAFGRSPAPQIFIGKLPSAWGDEALFYRVWMNLIDNAFKYSARTAQPQVKISAFANGDFVTYLVKDNGIGFEMALSNKLFGVFQRLHAGQGFPGTGVGLAIVERIVTRHGGRVWAESRPNEGSTFFFSLPVSANSFADEAVPPPSAETQTS